MVDEAQRVRVIRAITGWSQKAMAKRCAVAGNTVSGWERGLHIPQAKQRQALAKICTEFHIVIRSDGYPVIEDK